MKQENIYHKRNLPHFYPQGATFFVTFRLKDTIPTSVLKEWDEIFKIKKIAIEISNLSEQEKELKKDILEKQYFVLCDNYLDKIDNTKDYLKNTELANIVKDALLYYENKYYQTLAYCIMSNHVHWVFDTAIQLNNPKYINLPQFMKVVKGYSAYACNKFMSTEGEFWQHESYDRVVRNETELNNILNYVANNPVKAGLIDDWTQWQHTYRI